jgi:iron complex transport system substrate-binding protein
MPGERSRTATWDEVKSVEPEFVVCMPCGYDLAGATEQMGLCTQLQELGAEVHAVDASGHFSRPGPRLIDGIEDLARILHPDALF